MESLIAKRIPVRGTFTKRYNNLMSGIKDEKSTRKDIEIKISSFERIASDLASLDDEIYELLLAAKPDDLAEEFEKIEEYKEKIDIARVEAKIFMEKFSAFPEKALSVVAEKTKLKLPKIELVKFSGEIKDWLSFWSQFSRIHDDEFMSDEDKFQYLIQCMVSGSRAKEIVDSYPPSADNYTKVIESLKTRFGRDELLVEYYVRELLTLVVKNAINTKTKMSVMQLYDKLESYLRSLESIGVTKEKYAAMLFPLVESSIPEDLLRVWLRNPVLSKGDSYGDKLSQLLSFLRAEVEGEERISLAKTGFKQNDSSQRKKDKEFEISSPVATANDLFTSNRKKEVSHSCLFCLKGHETKECFQAQNMSFEEKREKIKHKKACFACLQIGHTSKTCRTYVKCLICGRKHWAVMCPTLTTLRKEKETRKVEKEEEVQSTSMSSNSCSGEVFLQTLLVKLENNGKNRTVRAVFDTGAQQTYILESTAREMGYKPVGTADLTHILFGGTTTEKKSHNCYKIKVSDMSKNFSCTLQVLDHGAICGKLPRLNRGPWEKELKQKNIWISDYGEGQPEIELLIGSDVCGTLFTGNLEKLDCGLVAIETRLGWMIMGKVSDRVNCELANLTITSLFCQTSKISNLWELDILGIRDPVEKKSREEQEFAALHHFKNTVSKNKDGRYEVHLPWLESKEFLKENRNAAEKRCLSMSIKLQEDGKYANYGEVFKDWEESGIIEVVPENELENPSYYLPHRGIFKENSTTRVRPVFDASSHERGSPSLNDCLEKGPNLLEEIHPLMMRFRKDNIGVVSDIKKAFLQISVTKEDCDFLRFLWWENFEERKFKVFRHKRVVFGLTCSPFLLTAVLNSVLEDSPPTMKETANLLKKSFYVDNCLTSVANKEELEKFILESRRLLEGACFDLRGWEHTALQEVSILEEPTHVLGILWDKVEDTLFCDLGTLQEVKSAVTRRNVLSTAQKIFDPLGVLCPVTLTPKLIVQHTWKLKIGWDREIPERDQRDFENWKKYLPLLSDVKIPRNLGICNPNARIDLHVFCDASQVAYSAVAFFRKTLDENITVHFVQAKSRLAPLHKMTIPRLELLACCIGARLAFNITVAMELKDISITYWSDSSTALCWIKRDDNWGVFVNNRVKEIRQLSSKDSWKHVSGEYNPADLPSRGCSVRAFMKSRWWEGPSWLKLREEMWPVTNFQADEVEISKEKQKGITSTLVCSEEFWPHSDISVQTENISQESKKMVVAINIKKEPPWYCRRFSSYLKTVRTIAWMKRFVNNAKKPASTRNTSELTVMEIEKAEIILLRLIQRDAFGTIKTEALKCLHPTLDEDGLIHTATRLVHRQDTDSFKNPIVLPSKHPVVKLLILAEHRAMSHAGVQTLMTRLREKYWILQCRRTVRQALRDCKNCRRFDSSRIEVVPAPLPENRVKDASVFQIIGVDLGGPMYLRTGEKAWFVLFTCAVIRAVHIELVLSLSTDSFLLAFRRFVARRGRPLFVYSDNGPNLVGASNALQGINWEKIKEVSLAQRIQWIFIPPTAAWWGGWWERLVGMIKNILRRVLGKARLRHDELVTVMCEAENIVNLRPLTYLSEDVEDLQPLTPSLFLHGTRDSSVPDMEDLDSTSINKRYQYRQKLKENLRQRFRTEYLGQLRSYSWKRCSTPLQIGQIVLVGNDKSKRLSWPLAKVLELYPGRDKNVRVARLKTAQGEILRPLQRLYPMEMNSDSLDSVQKKSEPTHSEHHDGSLKEAPIKAVESAQSQTRLRRHTKVPSRFQDFELNY